MSSTEFHVTVYHLGEMQCTDIPDRFSIPATSLFSGVVHARDEKSAAVVAWIDHVGQYQDQRLEALNAPQAIRDAHIMPGAVADQMKECSIGYRGFLLDNGVEQWLIEVQKGIHMPLLERIEE